MIKYGINTFIWASPFRTKDLPLLGRAKSLGFDLVEIPIEGEQDIDYKKAAEEYRRTELACVHVRVSVLTSNREPTEISWYLSGKLAESTPVTGTLEVAKQIAVKRHFEILAQLFCN